MRQRCGPTAWHSPSGSRLCRWAVVSRGDTSSSNQRCTNPAALSHACGGSSRADGPPLSRLPCCRRATKRAAAAAGAAPRRRRPGASPPWTRLTWRRERWWASTWRSTSSRSTPLRVGGRGPRVHAPRACMRRQREGGSRFPTRVGGARSPRAASNSSSLARPPHPLVHIHPSGRLPRQGARGAAPADAGAGAWHDATGRQPDVPPWRCPSRRRWRGQPPGPAFHASSHHCSSSPSNLDLAHTPPQDRAMCAAGPRADPPHHVPSLLSLTYLNPAARPRMPPPDPHACPHPPTPPPTHTPTPRTANRTHPRRTAPCTRWAS